MITKKKRNTIIAISTIITISIIVAVLAFVYFNTDIIKSNKILFKEYISKNPKNIEELYIKLTEDDFRTKLMENKSTQETQIKINYTQNVGTTSENTNNSINQLKLKINGQTDFKEKYNYQNIKLLKNDNDVAKIEYMQNNNVYGIKFPDLFKQYISVENLNLKELLKNAGYSEQEIEKMPDKIEINIEKDDFKFSKEEKEKIKEKYLNIIMKDFEKEQFEKRKNQIIKINDSDVKVNEYILKTTKENLNEIYIKTLTELKQDEIIIGKIELLQQAINKYNNDINIKEKFVNEIDNAIEKIQKNNIGKEEAKIIVYENKKETIRTSIITNEYKINFDCLPDKLFAEINFEDLTAKNKRKVSMTFTQKDENRKICIESTKNEEYKILTFEENKKIQDDYCNKNITIKYEDSENKLETTINQKIAIVQNLQDVVILDKENNVKLNDLNENQLQLIIDKVQTELKEKIDKLEQDIKVEELKEMLKNIGVLDETIDLESRGITEIEKNRFNSKFELLVADGLKNEDIVRIIKSIKSNLESIESTSNNTLKLLLSNKEGNTEIADKVATYFEKTQDKEYNISIEYDEETGLAKYIVIKIIKE